MTKDELIEVLKQQGNYPAANYISNIETVDVGCFGATKAVHVDKLDFYVDSGQIYAKIKADSYGFEWSS